jgi:hypothetical protein
MAGCPLVRSSCCCACNIGQSRWNAAVHGSLLGAHTTTAGLLTPIVRLLPSLHQPASLAECHRPHTSDAAFHFTAPSLQDQLLPLQDGRNSCWQLARLKVIMLNLPVTS